MVAVPWPGSDTAMIDSGSSSGSLSPIRTSIGSSIEILDDRGLVGVGRRTDVGARLALLGGHAEADQLVDPHARVEDRVIGVEDRQVELVAAGRDRGADLEDLGGPVVGRAVVDDDPVGVEERAVDADDAAVLVERDVARGGDLVADDRPGRCVELGEERVVVRADVLGVLLRAEGDLERQAGRTGGDRQVQAEDRDVVGATDAGSRAPPR